jgi:hypothetical protein
VAHTAEAIVEEGVGGAVVALGHQQAGEVEVGVACAGVDDFWQAESDIEGVEGGS